MLCKWHDKRDVFMIATDDEGNDDTRMMRRKRPNSRCHAVYSGTIVRWVESTIWTKFVPTMVSEVRGAGGGSMSSGEY